MARKTGGTRKKPIISSDRSLLPPSGDPPLLGLDPEEDVATDIEDQIVQKGQEGRLRRSAKLEALAQVRMLKELLGEKLGMTMRGRRKSLAVMSAKKDGGSGAGAGRFVKYRQLAFLLSYSQMGNVRRACMSAHITPSSHYRWLRESEEEGGDGKYMECFQDVLEMAADLMEEEATRRAIRGIEEPVFYKGEVVGHIRKYSDLLLIFMLKGARPEKFRDRFEVSRSSEDIAKLAKLLGVSNQEVQTAMTGGGVRMLSAGGEGEGEGEPESKSKSKSDSKKAPEESTVIDAEIIVGTPGEGEGG